MTNENTAYETFARDVYKELLHQDGIKNVNVQHNQKIKGKSGCEHQIDVYWEFIIAGIKHRVAVECKNYSDSVPIGKIRDFSAVLEDLGDVKGIFVAKIGYQSGAKEFAKAKGIELKLLREPEPSDWNDNIKTISLSGIAISRCNLRYKFDFDNEWIKKEKGLKKGDTFKIKGLDNEIFIVDDIAKTKKSLREFADILPASKLEEKDKEYTVKYQNAYLVTPEDRIKINTMQIIYDVIIHKMETLIDAQQFVKAIIKDIANGAITFIKK